jgi:hypothetical protein
MRLETLLNEIKPLHTKILKPVLSGVSIRNQWGVKTKQPHVQLGLFYELITHALKGGRLTGINQQNTPSPDVTTETGFFESKAAGKGRYCTLTSGQTARYRSLQDEHPEAEINYIFFRHGFKKIKSYQRGYRSLFNQLAQLTYFAVEVPLSLVHEIAYVDAHSKKIYATLARNDEYVDAVNVRSSTINQLLMDPLEIGDPERFSFERYLVTDVTISGISVEPFLFTKIKDNDHNKWLNTLRNLPDDCFSYHREESCQEVLDDRPLF